jgi:hypothetical protein
VIATDGQRLAGVSTAAAAAFAGLKVLVTAASASDNLRVMEDDT